MGTFATRTYIGAGGASMTYYLYGPPSYTPYDNYPLILILHGGEPLLAGPDHLSALIDALRAVPVEIESVEQVRTTLEESFIKVVSAGSAS